jgi:hypothetical protein
MDNNLNDKSPKDKSKTKPKKIDPALEQGVDKTDSVDPKRISKKSEG